MSISYPLSLPAQAANRTEFYAVCAVAVTTSPFSFRSQRQQFSGQYWGLEMGFPVLTREQAEPWIAFLLKLNGPAGTFLAGDPQGRTPRGVATGTPLVKGASQTGQSLITDGWTASTTNILKAGDYLQIGQRLYKNLSDVDSNGSGEATLDIWPALRDSPSDNESITLENTKGLFRLEDNKVPLMSLVGTKDVPLYGLKLSAVEAI